jgi:hypothetical protein
MADFLLPTLAVAATALLLRAGAAHLAHPGALREVLDRQDLVPPRLRRPLAVGLGGVELALGLVAGVALVGDTGSSSTGLVVAVLGAAFTAFLLVLRQARPAAPCGCGGTDAELAGVGPVDLGRAAVVLAGGLALAAGAAGRLAGLEASEQATTVVAGVAVVVVVDGAARVRAPRSSPRSPVPVVRSQP